MTALHNHFFWDGRNDLKVSEMGATINARMGLNTWAAFTGTNEKAAIADRPMIIFLHYWGTGSAETLATGFKAALNELGKHAGASR